jgi:integrase/recombinase XerD
LNDCASRNLGTETTRKYKHLFSQLVAYTSRKGITVAGRIRLDDLTEFRSTWKDGPLSSSKKLERLRWVKENLGEEITTPKVPDNPTLPFSEDEMKAIFTAAKASTRYASQSTYAFILVMRYSGLRISDVTTLRRDSISGRRIALYTAKTGEPVSMLLPSVVVETLQTVVSKNARYFFWSGESTREAAVSLWRKRLSKVFEDAKVNNGHSHRFRDTFAVSLLASGVSMQDLSTLLAHRSIRITQKHYAPWDRSRQAALDNALAKVEISIPA